MRATPWIWGRGVDVLAFAGSAAVALLLALLSPWLAPAGAVPVWAWFVFVLGLDVTHVWTTLYRTYFDREEVARRRRLYLGLPVVCYVLGVLLHSYSGLMFWRLLAYAAVYHFVRQQAGWVAIYRARAGECANSDGRLDVLTIYTVTGVPLFYWHTHLPRQFFWFVRGDFVSLAGLRGLLPLAYAGYGAVMVAYVGRSLWHWRRGHAINWGKHLVVVTTALIWGVGIVLYDGDFAFTVTNVTIHAVPYMVLLWMYARARAEERPQGRVAQVVAAGVVAFLGLALLFAFAEEWLWERLIWHDQPGWFGGPVRQLPLLGEAARVWLVPLLALPQAVHYALDGVLWRSRDAGPAQARALGFAPRRAAATSLPR